MENIKMARIDRIREFMCGKVKNDEMEEKWKKIADIIAENQIIPRYTPEIERYKVKQKDLEEQVSLKKAETCEYEEGDEKKIKEGIKRSRKLREEAEEKVLKIETEVTFIDNQADAIIDQLLRKMRKMRQFSQKFELEQAKSKAALQIATSKLDTTIKMVQNCHQQEIDTLNQIASIDKKVSDENNKRISVQSALKKKKEVTSKVLEYENLKIPTLMEGIKKNMEQVDKQKAAIQEKTLIKGNLANDVKELTKKVQDELKDHDLILTNIEQVNMKRALLGQKKTLMDIESDEQLSDLTLLNAFQEAKDSIQGLNADKVQISKDMENTKQRMSDLEQKLTDMDCQKVSDNLERHQNELVSVNETHDKMRKELKELMKFNAKSNKTTISQNVRIQSMNDEYNELVTELDQIAKQNEEKSQRKIKHREQKEKMKKSTDRKIGKSVKQSAAKKIEKYLNKSETASQKGKRPAVKEDSPGSSQMTGKRYVGNWLQNLPQKFADIPSENPNASIAFTNNTVEYDNDIEMFENEQTVPAPLVKTTKSSESLLYKKVYDLEPSHPDEIEDNMNQSFSEINNTGSEFWFDDTFMDLNNNYYNRSIH